MNKVGRAGLVLAMLALAACGSDDPDETGQGGAGGMAAFDVGAGGMGEADAAVEVDAEVDIPDMGAGMCEDLTVYVDRDGDGYGTDEMIEMACLRPAEELSGYARNADDCAPGDVWRNPGAEEICNDNVDDDCDGDDAPCPETNAADLDIPAWDCTGVPPPNVYAWARFADGGEHFMPGGCFVFFEGLKGEFYVQRAQLTRSNQDASCDTMNGCTCPSLNGWPAYDRRLYAYTLRGDADACAETSIIDHGGEDQPVSNHCRKYLYQLHFYDIPYNYVAGSVEGLQRRLELFPTVEIACAEDAPHANLPFVSLLTAPIERNPNFEAK